MRVNVAPVGQFLWRRFRKGRPAALERRKSLETQGKPPEPVFSPERCPVVSESKGSEVMQTTAQSGDVRETHSLIASDKVEGTPVRRTDGDKIGTIERVMIEKRSGKVAYAVMSFGGFMGLGEEYYTLPWGVLKYNTQLDAYELNLTEDQLRGAPRRTAEGHDASYDREWEEHVHRYYNATPYWGESDPMSTGR
jgi:hypothetical protein